jgi:hypothetical protein
VTATFQQREAAAEVLRAGGTQVEAARAAGVDVSTLKRWLKEPSFKALIAGSPDIRAGRPQRLGEGRGVSESQRDLRCRLWVAADGEVLGSYIPPAALEGVGAVLHVHVVQADAVESVVASIGAGVYPTESPYIPFPLAGLNDLLDNLPLVCRLGCPDARESLEAWLELWTFIDEEGRTRTLAESLWEGQRRFLEVLLGDGHVLSIKSRKVGLSTLVCAHAAWTARIRDVNASVHLLSYRADAAQELLRSLRRGFEGLPSFLRLPLARDTSSVLCFAAGPGDTRTLKAFPATPTASIEATSSHLVLDEWAHTFDPEKVWAAVEPTLAPRASSVLITTARTSGDFVHDYYLRSEAGETRHTAVFVSVLERSDRSLEWLEQKRRQEGKARTLRNYPLSAEEAFAYAGDPYFAGELLEAAQRDALPPSPAQRGDRYLKAWDVGRKDASVCVVLRAPAAHEVEVWHVASYQRLVGQEFPTIQRAIETIHHQYPGPTVVEANSIGLPILQNLNLPESELIAHMTTQASKEAMLTEIEIQLQQQTLKIHRDFQQLLAELADYRLPDVTLTQDSVMALGFAVINRHHANALTGGRINWELFYELNDLPGPPPGWFDRQKLTSDGPSFGLVRVEFEDGSTTHYDPNDPADCRRVESIRTETQPGSASFGHQANSLAGKREALLLWTESQRSSFLHKRTSRMSHLTTRATRTATWLDRPGGRNSSFRSHRRVMRAAQSDRRTGTVASRMR